jgi:hypothetical protein
VSNLLPHLLLASSSHRQLGQELQLKVDRFRDLLASALDIAWMCKSDVDIVKDKLIGEEERTREAWLSAQRGYDATQGHAAIAAGAAAPSQEAGSMGGESNKGVILKPIVGQWRSRSRFL